MGDTAARLKKVGHEITTDTLMKFIEVFFREETEKAFTSGKVEAIQKKF